MQICSRMPFLNCGMVCKDTCFYGVNRNNKPIDLALVEVDITNTINPYILINYSQNLEFEFGGINPKLSIVYRIVRKSNYTQEIKILESWNYKVSEVIPTVVENLNTIEPLVLNFCDTLENMCNIYENSYTYIVQLVDVIIDNTNFSITNQEISAIVNYGSRHLSREIYKQ